MSGTTQSPGTSAPAPTVPGVGAPFPTVTAPNGGVRVFACINGKGSSPASGGVEATGPDSPNQNGVGTSSSCGIQEAIARLPPGGGTVEVVGNGVGLVTRTILVPDRVRIHIAAGVTLQLAANLNDDMFRNARQPVGIPRQGGDVGIQFVIDGAIDGSRDRQTNTAPNVSNGIRLTLCSEVYLEVRGVIRNFEAKGLLLDACHDFQIPYLHAESCGLPANLNANIELIDCFRGRVGEVVSSGSAGDGMHIAGTASPRAVQGLVPAGATSIVIAPNVAPRWYVGTYLLLGGMDAATGAASLSPSELVQITGWSGNTLRISPATAYPHAHNESMNGATFDISVDKVTVVGNATQGFALESGVERINVGVVFADTRNNVNSLGCVIQGRHHRLGRFSVIGASHQGLVIRSDGNYAQAGDIEIQEVEALDNAQTGVLLKGVRGVRLGKVSAKRNGRSAGGPGAAGVRLTDDVIVRTSYSCSEVSITELWSTDDQATKTQQFGLVVEGTSPSGIRVLGGDCGGNGMRPVLLSSPGVRDISVTVGGQPVGSGPT